MVQKYKQVKPHKNKGDVNEGIQTIPQSAPRSTSDTRKRLRELPVSPEASAAKKPVEKRPKASNKEEKWVKVPVKKNLQKKKKAFRTPERPCRARPKAVLIKPVEGMSYASIQRELQKRVNPDELGATVQGIRKT